MAGCSANIEQYEFFVKLSPCCMGAAIYSSLGTSIWVSRPTLMSYHREIPDIIIIHSSLRIICRRSEDVESQMRKIDCETSQFVGIMLTRT